MAPNTVHLFAVPDANDTSTIQSLWKHIHKPLTVAKAHYFISTSHLSSTLQNDPATNKSLFNLVTILPGSSVPAPEAITSISTKTLTFNIDIEDHWIANYKERNSTLLHSNKTPVPPFPLHPTSPPDPNEEEVELPLTQELRTFFADFSAKYSGPVTMFNFLAFEDGMFPQYQKYMNAFIADLGPKYGAAPRFVGEIVKTGENGEEGKGSEVEEKWEKMAFVHYDGAANFGRMLEDEMYKGLDRKYKKGVVKDNPVLLVVELEE
ncbi:hypothetical protein IFR04_008977 [Cadophora malorum]|uniref:Uncharacterized protein n=1 Tax=Cadophora malorum TaxID=108018 RepID=A0A8H7TFM3_9HELO|nr:hypothetical protein IFR04_008977 [Cadophora malorum]